MYAIVCVYGKQYHVQENQILKIDQLDLSVGSEIEFIDVLCLFKNEKMFFGQPYLNTCKIKCCVLKHDKEKKINIIKFKRRKHHMKKMGHRQNYTMIKILSIYDN